MNFRWLLFWTRDFITGGKVYKSYKNIKRNYFYKGNKNDLEKKQLEQLLKFATQNSKFYKNFDGKTLEEFPIVNKQILRENENELLTQKKVEHIMSTSGSTGTPLVIKQDKNKRNHVIAEILFFGKIANYEFGEKQIYYRIWNEHNNKNKLQKMLQNMVTTDISDLKEDKLKNLAQDLKKSKAKNIISYASTLDVLSRYMIENNYNKFTYSIKSIFSGSEMLTEETRQNLKKVFKCEVYSRYSNQENGVLAQEVNDGEYFAINNADYYIEFLSLDNDEKAKEGEISRIVVTDLYNYSTPVIRYDTGDLAIFNTDKYGNNVITELYGRKVDSIYNIKGEQVSPHMISINMWGIKGIKQFKFIQINNKEYKIQLNIDDNNAETMEQALKEKYKKLLGNDATIYIEYVKEIPILSSGKRKYIENITGGKYR